ncbi:MAG: SIS domain-containing protein, partial [Reichenbachiella sp.]|uniref:SIS domain-containing protein n=1 Tax=Reichenbachiella sp. TaxID=2184521 RepID=UPI003297D374
MEVFGVDSVLAEELGVKHTSQEICQQPELWHEVYDVIKNQKKELQAYLEGAYADVDKIILTGAGTSAFIGLSARRSFHNQVGIETQAIATTDLVTHYRDFVQKQESVLLVSFARSGDSPESIAAVEHMSSYVKKCYNLIITCNEGGQLMRMNAEIDNYCVLLPSKSNDQSLAMTSSYTSMLLAGLLVSRIKEIEAVERQVNLISHYASEVINKQAPKLQEIARLSFDRAVFLGSGPYSGSAKEAHL